MYKLLSFVEHCDQWFESIWKLGVLLVLDILQTVGLGAFPDSCCVGVGIETGFELKVLVIFTVLSALGPGWTLLAHDWTVWTHPLSWAQAWIYDLQLAIMHCLRVWAATCLARASELTWRSSTLAAFKQLPLTQVQTPAALVLALRQVSNFNKKLILQFEERWVRVEPCWRMIGRSRHILSLEHKLGVVIYSSRECIAWGQHQQHGWIPWLWREWNRGHCSNSFPWHRSRRQQR